MTMGRPPGSKNSKAETEAGKIKEEIEAKGKKTPLEFMLEVMWNTKANAALRLEAARNAAPYIHRKQPIELQASGEVEIIPPFVPSKRELRKDFAEELGDIIEGESVEIKVEDDDYYDL